MDILIVNPPWTFYAGSNGRLGGPPSTVATVAAAFREAGMEVGVLDCMASDAYWECGDAIQCGLTDEEIEQAIVAANPKAIGVSCTWTAQFGNAKRILRIARNVLPHVKMIAGGHDIAARPKIAESAGFNVSVIGEIENVAEEVAWIINKGPKWASVGGSPVRSLDTLQLPAYDLLDLDYYHKAQRKHHGSLMAGGMPVVTSRGCPYRCSFCTVHLSMGRHWRGNSPEYVIRHFEHLESLGFTQFHIEDDNLTMDPIRWTKVMESMRNRGWRWDTPNGIRLDLIDWQFVELAKESGCVELRVAPESASSETVNMRIGKHLDTGTLPGIARLCSDAGIRLCAFWVIGIPGETRDEIKATLDCAESMEQNYGIVPRVSIATPYPGTELYKQCIEEGWLGLAPTEEAYGGATHGKGMIKTPEFDGELLQSMLWEWNERRGYGSLERAVRTPEPTGDTDRDRTQSPGAV